MNAYLWQMRHTKSHHIFPNVNGCDIDIDENPFLRLSPNQPWRPYFRFQHLYAPLAYLAVALHTVLWQDFVYLFKRRLANLTDITHRPHRYAAFALGKAAYFGMVLALPMAALPLPWWQVLLGYLAMQGVASLVFVFLLVGTHFSDATDFPVVAADGSVGHGWATHNLVTACDWAPHSRLAHFLVGGVNAHASHHLFPNVSHAHYRAIARIIEDTAANWESGITGSRCSGSSAPTFGSSGRWAASPRPARPARIPARSVQRHRAVIRRLPGIPLVRIAAESIARFPCWISNRAGGVVRSPSQLESASLNNRECSHDYPGMFRGIGPLGGGTRQCGRWFGGIAAVNFALNHVWPHTGPKSRLVFALIAPWGVVLFALLVEQAGRIAEQTVSSAEKEEVGLWGYRSNHPASISRSCPCPAPAGVRSFACVSSSGANFHQDAAGVPRNEL